MQYRTMPGIAEKLSVLGFGCMRLPLKSDHSLDRRRAIGQIRLAADKGVNYFDTAWPYHGGESESLLGEALQDGYREKVLIATKLPSWMVKSRAMMDRFLSDQIKKLRAGQVDFYLMHALDGPMWEALKRLDVLDFIDKARQDGRIRYAGFSFHGRPDDFKTIVDDYPWEFCQIQYNYLDENHQAGKEGLEYAHEKGLGVVVMEPLRGGNLGRPNPPPPVADILSNAPVRRPPVEWALRWIWDHPEVTVVLSGMNEESHIEENISVADRALPGSLKPAERELVREVSEKYRELMKVGCTGCEYCKPCPEGVNISAAFEILNLLHLFQNPEEAKFLYAVRCSSLLTGNDDHGYASNCVRCGECVEKCPQGIAIPDMLEKAAESLEDDQLENRFEMARKMLNMK